MLEEQVRASEHLLPWTSSSSSSSRHTLEAGPRRPQEGGVVTAAAVKMSTPARAAPPPPPVRKGHVQAFEAISNYKAKRDCELSFEEGDLLFVTDRSDPDWFLAIADKKKGYIPSNHVSSENARMPIVDAGRRGNFELLDECLVAGVSVNALDKSGCSALHGVAQGGHVQCLMRLLKEPKLAINLQNKLGDTPLHCAAVRGHSEVVRVLLDHGAQQDITNRDNQTPRSLAKNGIVISILDEGPEHQQRNSGFESHDYGAENSDDSD